MERITQIQGAYDKRNTGPKMNYGIHGMTIRFILLGELGATQFVVYTQMHLPHVQDELWKNSQGKHNPFKPMGADIGYHSPIPQYAEQDLYECDILSGKRCHYDGTSLGASEFMPTFLTGGSDAVWPMLEERYKHYFGELK